MSWPKGKKRGPMSAERRAAMSGENHPRYGIPRTEEQKAAQSAAMMGSKNPQYGIPRTEETKAKMTEEEVNAYSQL